VPAGRDKKSIVDEVQTSAAALEADRRVARLERQNADLQSRYKGALKELERAEARIEFADAVAYRETGPAIRPPGKPKPGASTAVLVLTDWHVEETVDPATINGANEYNLAIAAKRATRVFQKTLELLEFSRKFHRIDHFVVPLLGDFITGYIHEELEESNGLSPTEATLFVQDLIVPGIELLSKEAGVKSIVVPTCFGNHGRTTKKKRVSTGHKNSYEWLMYHQMARYLRRDPKVRFQIADGYHNWVDIQGHPYRLHHGDAINFQGGVGGISIPTNKKVAAWNTRKRAACDLFGHFHQARDWGSWVCCNCLIGYNAYAMALGAEWSPPSQTFMVVSEKYGRGLTMPVFCEDRYAAAPVGV
jgi:hypothetical protein